MKARDNQRTKVYRLEGKLFPTASKVVLDEVGARELVKRAARKFRVYAPNLKFTGRGWYGGGFYRSWEGITFRCGRRRTTTAEIALHEFAHHVCRLYYGSWPAWHGPEFFRCFFEVMKWAGHFEGRYSQSKHHVKIASCTKFWMLHKLHGALKGVK